MATDSHPQSTISETEQRSRRFSISSVLLATLAVLFAIAFLLVDVARPFHGVSSKHSGLEAISRAIQQYSQDHLGEFPDSSETLRQYALSKQQNTPPPPSDSASQLPYNWPFYFVYLGGEFNQQSVKPDQILAYQSVSIHDDQLDVLLGDGRISFVSAARGRMIIAARPTTRPVMLPP